MKEGCSEKLQPMEDPCEIKDNPKRTVACKGHMLGQENSKKQGTERNYCTLTTASSKGLEGTECHV